MAGESSSSSSSSPSPAAPEVEAEVVVCAACGSEHDLRAHQVGAKTVFLCPFCTDTGRQVVDVARRIGMTALARVRAALAGRG